MELIRYDLHSDASKSASSFHRVDVRAFLLDGIVWISVHWLFVEFAQDSDLYSLYALTIARFL